MRTLEITDSMVRSYGGLIYIQIDNAEPFIPDQLNYAGIEFGTRADLTGPVKVAKPSSMVSRISYVLKGTEFNDFYRSGKWAAMVDGSPVFCVWGLLGL